MGNPLDFDASLLEKYFRPIPPKVVLDYTRFNLEFPPHPIKPNKPRKPRLPKKVKPENTVKGLKSFLYSDNKKQINWLELLLKRPCKMNTMQALINWTGLL